MSNSLYDGINISWIHDIAHEAEKSLFLLGKEDARSARDLRRFDRIPVPQTEEDGGHRPPKKASNSLIEATDLTQTLAGSSNTPRTSCDNLRSLAEGVSTLRLAHEFFHLLDGISFPKTEEDQVKVCVKIGVLVVQFFNRYHPSEIVIGKAQNIYRIFHECTRSKLRRLFRLSLVRAEFPTYPSYRGIMEHLQTYPERESLSVDQLDILRYAEDLVKLDILDSFVSSHRDRDNERAWSALETIDELARVIFYRIKYHFIETAVTVATCIAYLLEILLKYVKETLNLGRICELIQIWIPSLTAKLAKELVEVIDCDLITQLEKSITYKNAMHHFLCHIVTMINHVLTQRNYFNEILNLPERDELLRSGIEHIITFDLYVQTLSISSDDNETPRLLNDMVACNTNVFSWWKEYEYRLSFAAMQSSLTMDSFSIGNAYYLNPIISPTAETFSSIARSLFLKAKLISTDILQRDFLACTLVPISVEYIESIHSQASSLRSSVLKCPVAKLLLPKTFEKIIRDWMQVISSAHLAWVCFKHYEEHYSVNTCLHDIHRLIESFRKLRDGMISEVSKCFVENILLEKTKLASFFIRSSHLLSMSNVENDHNYGITSDLVDATHLLNIFANVCYSEIRIKTLLDMKETAAFIQFSSDSMMESVASLLEDRLIDITMDVEDTIVTIQEAGALVFKAHVDEIVSSFSTHTLARLKNVLLLMTLGRDKYSNLRTAVLQLLPESDESFPPSEDPVLNDQIQSMLHALGIELSTHDTLRVLNKREI